MSGHSSMGFSGQGIIIPCPATVRMSEGVDNDTNDAAEKGTAVHECAEAAIKLGCNCQDFVGDTFNGFKITKRMAEAGQVYVDEIRKLLRDRNAKLHVELKVAISTIDKELLRGTSDCVIVDIENSELIIGDYKNGFGVVEVDKPIYSSASQKSLNGNAQLVGYALAALDTLDLWGLVNKVTTFVCQPNFEHVDGITRYKTYTMAEMREWWNVYYLTYQEAKRPDSKPNAGEHCKYCRAAGHCATRMRRTIELLSLDNGLDYLLPEQITEIYKEIGTIRRTLEAVENRTTSLARKGTTIEGYKLVKPILRAKCSDEDSFITDAIEAGVDEGDLFNRRMKGKTELKKLMDKKLVDKYFPTPTGDAVLVSMSDKRPAVIAGERPNAVGVFNEVKK